MSRAVTVALPETLSFIVPGMPSLFRITMPLIFKTTCIASSSIPGKTENSLFTPLRITDDRIYLDAMFSPVRQVTYDVEKTRVGGDIDYDKLSLHIHTDGSENPLDVLHYAVSVLRTQLEHFLASAELPFNQISHIPEQAEYIEDTASGDLKYKGIPVDLFFKPIEELELSVRAHNCLVQEGIKRILDLVNRPEDELLKYKNFGRKSLNEVKDSLKAFGLTLGMDIKESDLKKLMQS